jgi:hypothetical protein
MQDLQKVLQNIEGSQRTWLGSQSRRITKMRIVRGKIQKEKFFEGASTKYAQTV